MTLPYSRLHFPFFASVTTSRSTSFAYSRIRFPLHSILTLSTSISAAFLSLFNFLQRINK